MDRRSQAALLALLVLSLTTLSGCDTLAFVGRNLSDAKEYTVKAKYRGLDDQRVAVLVSAGEYVRFRYPNAASNTTRMVSTRLAENVPGIRMTDPAQMDRFRRHHRYWPTQPYSDLVDQLDVDRLVVIDLTEYRTHKPGNRHLWRGVMSGSVGVIANDEENPSRSTKAQTSPPSSDATDPSSPAESQSEDQPNQPPLPDAQPIPVPESDPNDFVFHDVVAVRFPPGGKIGLLDQDSQTMQIGMLTLFGRDVCRLFHRHKVTGEELRQRNRQRLDDGG